VEHKRKISEANKGMGAGRKASIKTRKKMSLSKMGQKPSPESIRKRLKTLKNKKNGRFVA
jgi:hypothetical protein